MQGTWVWSLVRELRFHMLWSYLGPHTTNTEARAPKSLCSKTREATSVESLGTTTRVSPHSNEDSAESKIKISKMNMLKTTLLDWGSGALIFNPMLEKTLESPLDCKETQPVHPKGDQSWVFIGRTDAEFETPILWPPHVKCWLIGKDPDAGRDWGKEEKGTTEDEMAGWHHRLNGHEFEQAPGVVMDREALCTAVPGVEKSWTWLSDWTELNFNLGFLTCEIREASTQTWHLMNLSFTR